MNLCIIGYKENGNTNLAQRLGQLYPNHTFDDASYYDLGKHSEKIKNCDSVIITVNLMEGPMLGTRVAIARSKNLEERIIGFCFTHLDEFDAQSRYGPHIKELVEFETRELASEYGYDDYTVPSVRLALIPGCEVQLKEFFEKVLCSLE